MTEKSRNLLAFTRERLSNGNRYELPPPLVKGSPSEQPFGRII